MQDLQETAELARLNLSEGELADAFPAVEQMLGYFAAMEAADRDESITTSALPEGMTASSRLMPAAYFRPDSAPPDRPNSADLTETMLSKAGERDGRFVVIPNVL